MPTRPGPAFAALVAAAVAVCPAALAGREPVLKQIDVPHNYYYREMYLPQATSGPNAVAWSPDGRYLVTSMQGSLWRHEPGSPVAEQLTDGPGYDYQPDWSPDGRRIALQVTSTQGKRNIGIFDVATGAYAQLPGDGNNQTPTWSPDGKRIVFHSTRSGRPGIWWQPADGSGTAQQLHEFTRGYASEGVVSPDGRWLAVLGRTERVAWIFDAATDAALRAWQKKNQLEVSGVAGDQAWAALQRGLK